MVEFAEQHNAVRGARAPKLVAVKHKRRSWASGSAVRLQVNPQSRTGQGRKLTAFQICCVAFDPRRNRHAAADAYNVSKQTVGRALVVAAVTLLEVQMAQLKEFKDFVLSCKPAAATATLMWDETQETLAMNSSHGPHRSSYSVLVARLHLAVGWVDRPSLKLWKDFVLAPMPLASNSAVSIWSALHGHPMVRLLLETVRDVLLSAKLRCWIHEADGHLSNEKLHFHTYHQAKANPPADGLPLFTELALCSNHQTNLVLMEAINNAPRSPDLPGALIPNMYCGCLWLRMGAHFLRLLSALRGLLQSEASFTWVQNPSQQELERGGAYRKELADFLVDNLRHHQRQMSPAAKQGQPGCVLTAQLQ